MSNFYRGTAVFYFLCAALGCFAGEVVVGGIWTLCGLVSLYLANTEE